MLHTKINRKHFGKSISKHAGIFSYNCTLQIQEGLIASPRDLRFTLKASYFFTVDLLGEFSVSEGESNQKKGMWRM